MSISHFYAVLAQSKFVRSEDRGQRTEWVRLLAPPPGFTQKKFGFLYCWKSLLSQTLHTETSYVVFCLQLKWNLCRLYNSPDARLVKCICGQTSHFQRCSILSIVHYKLLKVILRKLYSGGKPCPSRLFYSDLHYISNIFFQLYKIATRCGAKNYFLEGYLGPPLMLYVKLMTTYVCQTFVRNFRF